MSAISMIELVPSAIAFLVFYILWLIWFFFEMIFSWTTPFIRNKGKIVFEDMGSTVLIVVSSICCFIITMFFSLNGIFLLPSWFSYVGLVPFALGMIFRFWAILVLGKNFSPIVGTFEKQALITRGPYRYVRHPSYTGGLLMLFGYAVFLRSSVGSIATIVVMLFVYLYRIKVEEKVLDKKFPKAYLNYAKGKKKIVPWLV